MDWKGGRRSGNIQDRRGRGMKTGGGIGIVGIIIVLIGWAMGVDPRAMLNFVDSGSQMTTQSASAVSGKSADDDEQKQFVETILGSNEDVWKAQLAKDNVTFKPATLVLFSGRTQSACGTASSQTGPFYCPTDQRIYVDLGFIREMQQLGAVNNQEVVGNFAMGYVIAHEYGHHISNLLGILPQAHQAMEQSTSQAQANAISVRLELQADCFAGVWAANLPKYHISITQNDIAKGLQAAHAVGDDHIMQQAGRRANPENFTHGSSQQRMQWFSRGLKSGNMNACNTFSSSLI